MNRITGLLKIKYPIIQGGMIWCSGWRLASAISNAGGLGLIGAGSMTPDLLREHLRKCKGATAKPFGVNIPLLYSAAEEFISIMIEEDVKIIFTSAGNPGKYTKYLKDNGFTVVHVIANTKFAKKCEDSGVDAIVAEGFEAGGHNGKEETTTLVLIPMIKEVVSIPVIAAGGIGTGRGMLAAMSLGAEGVQVGSRFVASEESSAHPAFKQKIIESSDGDTHLILKKIVPVRLMKNKFFHDVEKKEAEGAGLEEISLLLGKNRPKNGMFEGDIDEGELEIGQISALIKEIKPAGEIIREMMDEFYLAKKELLNIDFE